jgi:hypothetical protein
MMHSKEFENQVLSLRSEGLRRWQIAERLGVHVFRIHRALDGNPLSPKDKKKRYDKWPEGTTEKILGLRKGGMRYAEIARVLGVSIGKVNVDIRASDIRLTKSHSTYPEELRKRAVALHDKFLPRREIAKKLGVALNAVNVMLKRERVGRIPEEVRLAHLGLRVWPKGTNEKILTMRRKGCSYCEIETALVGVGITRAKVLDVIHHSNIRFTEEQRISHLPVKYTQKQWEEVVKLRIQGLTFPEIEVKTGVNEGTASDYCSKKKIFLTQEQSLVNRRVSKAESDIYDFVKSICPDAEARKRGVLGRKEIDVYVPSLKLGIEYHGLYWHGECWADDKLNVLRKHQLARKEGVRLISIFEDEWFGMKQDIKDRLASVLNGKEKLMPELSSGNSICTDNRWSQDFLCEKAGFSKKRVTRPWGWYFRYGYPVRYIKGVFSEEFLSKGGMVKGKHYDRIWDAGLTVWEKAR